MLDQFTPVSIYEKIKQIYKEDITLLFESVLNGDDGNFSYIAVGYIERVWSHDGESFHKDERQNTTQISSNPFVFLKDYYKKLDKKYYKTLSLKSGLGFTDGFIGNIGYDMSKYFQPKLQQHMQNLQDEIDENDMDIIRPRIIIGFSHKTSKLTIITSQTDKKEEIDELITKLQSKYDYTPLKKAILHGQGSFYHTKEKFFDMVRLSKQKIFDGDIFQVLMTNRFTQKAVVDALSFYRVLRSKNPSPYLYLLEFENYTIAGSSPEVMIKLQDGVITLRPIAGTRKRGATTLEDEALSIELLADTKEIAEHIMLVDLGRNDVGRVAVAGSVQVSSFKKVEKYSHVMHIVSNITAICDERYDMFDLFEATFTAGTMTGAPKIRAMEIIADIEKLKRGFYSGSIVYFGFDGNMDSAITIRTSLIKEDRIIFQAGAGIVADSVAQSEYDEVINKLQANISTLDELALRETRDEQGETNLDNILPATLKR